MASGPSELREPFVRGGNTEPITPNRSDRQETGRRLEQSSGCAGRKSAMTNVSGHGSTSLGGEQSQRVGCSRYHLKRSASRGRGVPCSHGIRRRRDSDLR